MPIPVHTEDPCKSFVRRFLAFRTLCYPTIDTRFHRKDVKFIFYRPQQYLRKGYVFTGVFLSTGEGRFTSPLCQADTPLPGRHPLCQADTTPARQTPPCKADTPLPGRHPLPRDGYCSGRYASYWNSCILVFLY